MPLYEYRCTACDRLTEKRQKFSDAELKDCPYCGGRLERTITAPAVQFKGGGWYADGYGSKKPAASGEGGGAGGEKKPEAKADVKAESSSPAAEAGSSPKAEAAPAPAAASAPASKPAS